MQGSGISHTESLLQPRPVKVMSDGKGQTKAADDGMTPPSLDLLVLTFNCGKALLSVDTFASHLKDVFGHGVGAVMPEMVVL